MPLQHQGKARKNRPESGLSSAEGMSSSPQRLQLKTMDYASQQSALRPGIQMQEAGGGEAAVPEAAQAGFPINAPAREQEAPSMFGIR